MLSRLITISFIFMVFIQGCFSSEKRKDYKQLMRNFVIKISKYAKELKPNFIIIPQNGERLLTKDGNINSPLALDYIAAIDGVGREELFYGYLADDEETPETISSNILSFLNIAKNVNKVVLVIDYCSTFSKIDDSYNKNHNFGFIAFAADNRELNDIPNYPTNPYNENSNNINTLSDAKNFLCLINPSSYSNKDDFLNALKNTNFDIIIIDLFFNEQMLTKEDINSLKTKKNGGKRLVICYLSIGEAEDYRYYWKDEWYSNPPSFLDKENPDWPGNYKVKYWDPLWQAIISGNDSSYLKKIIDSNCDGVYLDGIDAFEYFENL